MCGIIGVYLLDQFDVKSLVKQLYESQKGRGTDGYGVLLANEQFIKRYRAQREEEIFRSRIWQYSDKAKVVLFHHRQPTSTPNLPPCNHPLRDCFKRFYIIHNGIVSQTKFKLQKKHRFESEIRVIESKYIRKKLISRKATKEITDSEILAHWLEERENRFRRNPKEVLGELAENLRWDAIIFFYRNHPNRMYWCSNGAPLFAVEAKHYVALAQYASNYSEDLRQAYGYIEDGKIKILGRIRLGFYEKHQNKYQNKKVYVMDDEPYRWMYEFF